MSDCRPAATVLLHDVANTVSGLVTLPGNTISDLGQVAVSLNELARVGKSIDDAAAGAATLQAIKDDDLSIDTSGLETIGRGSLGAAQIRKAWKILVTDGVVIGESAMAEFLAVVGVLVAGTNAAINLAKARASYHECISEQQTECPCASVADGTECASADLSDWSSCDWSATPCAIGSDQSRTRTVTTYACRGAACLAQPTRIETTKCVRDPATLPPSCDGDMATSNDAGAADLGSRMDMSMSDMAVPMCAGQACPSPSFCRICDRGGTPTSVCLGPGQDCCTGVSCGNGAPTCSSDPAHQNDIETDVGECDGATGTCSWKATFSPCPNGATCVADSCKALALGECLSEPSCSGDDTALRCNFPGEGIDCCPTAPYLNADGTTPPVVAVQCASGNFGCFLQFKYPCLATMPDGTSANFICQSPDCQSYANHCYQIPFSC